MQDVYKCNQCGYEVFGANIEGTDCENCGMGDFEKIEGENVLAHNEKQAKLYDLILDQFSKEMGTRPEEEKKKFVDLLVSLYRVYGDRSFFDLVTAIITTMEESCYTCANSNIYYAHQGLDEVCSKKIKCDEYVSIVK